MADHKIGCPTIGSAWAYALNLWVQFAQGTYTSWAYTMTTLNSGYAVKVDVGLSGGGTDSYYLQALDTNHSDYVRLRSIFESPGWRTMPQVVLPTTVPGGTGIDISFLNGPCQLRQSIVVDWANESPVSGADRSFSIPIGLQYIIVTFYVQEEAVVYLDVIGIMYGNLTGLDTVLGMPTDFIGNTPPVTIASGGGSVDLTPVISALNDIATREADYTANQGGTVWSLYGKVRVP